MMTLGHDVATTFGARVVETHISLLFFVGDRVYKLRKPVNFPFVDFTKREAREADCYREIEANRRFAPDVYLGVFDVVERGVPVDHLVVMRKLPEDRRLSTLLAKGCDVRAEIRAIARLLADCDAWLLRSDSIDALGTRDAVRSSWWSNFAEIEPFVGSLIDRDADARLRRLVARFLDGREELFRSRIAAGRIRDGHGDLQAQDIFCLVDGPRVLDCIEFDERLRYGDVLSDLAFLGMDLERLGGAARAEELFADFAELSGDSFPRSLRDHYGAARAYVRAKVACLAAAEGSEEAVQEAREFHDLALRLLERSRVRLVVVGGTPGTGKSVLASGLADELSMVVLRSDELRKELAGSADSAAHGAGPLPLYGDEMTDLTYRTMLDRATTALELGQSVVLDATWISEGQRRRARRVAELTHADLVELRCDAPADVIEQRIAQRLLGGADASDATVDVARSLAIAADPWPSASVIDTTSAPATALSAALHAVTELR